MTETPETTPEAADAADKAEPTVPADTSFRISRRQAVVFAVALAGVLLAVALYFVTRLGHHEPEDPSLIMANAAAATTFMEKTAKEPGVKALPSGVLYRVVASGPTDGVSPRPEDEVKVHYEGKLVSDEIFDSSFARGAPAVMQLGRLIPAWIEALQKMKPGDEWILYVPPALGYGEQGSGPIPPNSVLIFRIQLLGVLPAAGSTGFGN